MSRVADLPRRFWRFLTNLQWRWVLLAAVAAIVLVVVGFVYVDGLEWKSDERRTYTLVLFVLAGIGLVVAEIARQWRWVAGVVVAVLTGVGLWVGLGVLVDELDLGRFSESDRMPTASAEQVPELTERTPADPPAATSREDLESIELATELVADGLDQPVKVITSTGEGELLVAERTGTVRRIEADGTVVSEPVLDISDEIEAVAEQGLLGIALSPDGERLYVSWSVPRGDDDFSGVSSFAFDGVTADVESRQELFEMPQPYERHNGGEIAFGPDGYLYASFGDGGRLRDPHFMGQDRSTRLSTILRMLPTPDGDQPYVIPPDNPYIDEADTWPEIYAYGSRNPFRFSFDPETGDLWIGDVGEINFEEVHYMKNGDTDGANFGWSLMDADEVYQGKDIDPTGYTEADIPPDHVPPIFSYGHDDTKPEGGRNSITGGEVYRGTAIPELEGTYVYSDFTAGWYGLLSYDTEEEELLGEYREFPLDVDGSVAIGLDGDGEILLVTFGGEIHRLIPG